MTGMLTIDEWYVWDILFAISLGLFKPPMLVGLIRGDPWGEGITGMLTSEG